MEDVLDVYEQPYDPQRPVVCFDETPRQLLAEVRAPEPVQPGTPARQGCEYKRQGVAEILLFCEPLAGQRQAWVTGHRTKIEFSQMMERIVQAYPEADMIRVRHGQLEHPQVGRAIRGFPAGKSQRAPEEAGVPLHTQARQLAQHGRNRVLSPLAPVPGPAHARYWHLEKRGSSMASRAQPGAYAYPLAIHYHQGPRDDGTLLSRTFNWLIYSPPD
jgi:hypothetical protein